MTSSTPLCKTSTARPANINQLDVSVSAQPAVKLIESLVFEIKYIIQNEAPRSIPPPRPRWQRADSDRLDALIAELKGKDINTLISEGAAKLASVPSGGGGGAAAAGGAAAGGAAEAAPVEEKEEEKEESDDDMGFGLFD
ncbi:hypothetical protein V499_04090 [Pseudogymnoascus sp. VKM F-103]|nr:hypothetical protein V499_04090 [Pseudogymnoascus sp. VKM F-103]